jgi:hypothetical protein
MKKAEENNIEPGFFYIRRDDGVFYCFHKNKKNLKLLSYLGECINLSSNGKHLGERLIRIKTEAVKKSAENNPGKLTWIENCLEKDRLLLK